MNRRCKHEPTHRSDRGTVLMLFPAAVLVLCVMAALAVDSANTVMRKRALQSAADAAANDAAALAIDQLSLRDGFTVIDLDAARDVVAASLEHQHVVGLRSVNVRIEDGNVVVVDLVAVHPSVFARAIPGGPREMRVPARSSAQALTAGESEIPR